MKKQKNKFNLKELVRDNILEIILILGLFFIVLASMTINKTLGLYTLGVVLVSFSLYVARR